MTQLGAMFASGRIGDVLLALTAAEAAALVAYHRATGRGVPPGDFLANLLSGMCLMGALRLALSGAAWVWVAACLLGSLAAHATDLSARWRR